MDFSIELSQFPSMAQQHIYTAARCLTPLEVSLANMTDDALRMSCTAYHNFLIDMFSDIYEHPKAYHLPVGELEAFCAGKKINGVKQKYPSKTKNLLAQTRHSGQGYLVLLYLLGKMGTLDGDKLFVSAEDLCEIDRLVSSPVSPISAANRMSGLARIGLIYDGGCFTSKNHPNMFPAMCALAAKAKKLSGFDGFAFNNAEFRTLCGKFKPTYEDYFRPLSKEQKKYAHALHQYAIAHKLTPSISTFWKVNYKYKGNQVMCIGTQDDTGHSLSVRIVGTYNWDDPALINDRLWQKSPKSQRYALRHVHRCNACSTSHLGGFVTVLGKRQRVCGGSMIGFQWIKPVQDDMDEIADFIRMRCEIIDEITLKEKSK